MNVFSFTDEKLKLFIFQLNNGAWWRGIIWSTWHLIQSHPTAVKITSDVLNYLVMSVSPPSRNKWVSIVTFYCTLQYHQENFLFRRTVKTWLIIRSSRTLSIFPQILHSNIASIDKSNCSSYGKCFFFTLCRNCLDKPYFYKPNYMQKTFQIKKFWNHVKMDVRFISGDDDGQLISTLFPRHGSWNCSVFQIMASWIVGNFCMDI